MKLAILCEPYDVTDEVEQVLDEHESRLTLAGRRCRWIIYSQVNAKGEYLPYADELRRQAKLHSGVISIAELLARGFRYTVTLRR